MRRLNHEHVNTNQTTSLNLRLHNYDYLHMIRKMESYLYNTS